MRVGFPVVAIATGLAAVFVLAQAVQGVEGPDSPDVGPTIVLPAASPDESSDAPAQPVAPRTRTVPDRDPTTEALPRPSRKPKVAAGDPAEPRPVTPQPRRTAPRPTIPSTPLPTTPVAPEASVDPGTEPADSMRVPVPVCEVPETENSEDRRDRFGREDRDDDLGREERRERFRERWERWRDREDGRDRGCQD